MVPFNRLSREHKALLLEKAKQRVRDAQEDIARYERSLGLFLPDGTHSKEQLEHVFFSETKEEQLEWIWKRRLIRGKINKLVGLPGVGKSLITVDTAARVSRAMLWPDGTGRAPLGNVLIVSAEDGAADTILPRLRAHGADLERVAWIKGKKEPLGRSEKILTLDTDHALLEDKIEELKAVLTIFDPVLSFTGKRVNPNAEVEVREFLAPLAAISERTGTAMWGIMHYNKKIDLDKIQRVPGAAAWGGFTRSVMFAEENPNKPRTFLFGSLKMNLGPKPSILSYHIEDAYPGADSDIGKLLWDDELIDPYDPSTERTVPSESERAIALLEEMLSPYGPDVPGIPTVELNAEAQTREISMPTLQRARTKRGVISKKVGDAWHLWLPPTDHKPPSRLEELLEQPIFLRNNGEGDEGDDGLEGLEGVDDVGGVNGT